MVKTMTPCRDCQDRHIGCHGTCTRYLMFKAVTDKARHIRYQQGEVDDYVRQLIGRRHP